MTSIFLYDVAQKVVEPAKKHWIITASVITTVALVAIYSYPPAWQYFMQHKHYASIVVPLFYTAITPVIFFSNLLTSFPGPGQVFMQSVSDIYFRGLKEIWSLWRAFVAMAP